ncbi:polymer-forming cytoskeletal protein [Pendulispora rubella]|uniref:Polymer-forming cytoskeletal protein n=1 Tax=Pendulispora rubella TaxID=2741070 RepID=A0ABZ2L242_9BACT
MIDKSSSAASAPGTAAVKQTLVEEGTTFKGSLTSNCPIVVKGRIEGDVAAPSLNVSTSGSVSGSVKVTDLRSAGELSGDFESETVQLSGVIKDNTRLRAKSLEVRLAVPNGKMQVVFGECTLDVGEPLTKEEVIKAAAAPPVEAKPVEPAPEAKADDKKGGKDKDKDGGKGGGGDTKPSVHPKDGKEEGANGAAADATK